MSKPKISVPFSVYNVGNKRVAVEWVLDVVDIANVYIGEAFEAVDLNLVSVYAIAGSGVLVKMYGSNDKTILTIPGYGAAIDISGNKVLPFYPSDVNPFPPMRFYRASAESAVNFSHVTMLFDRI